MSRGILAVHPLHPGEPEIVHVPHRPGYVIAVAERAGHSVKRLDMHNLRLPMAAFESAELPARTAVH